MPRPLPRSLRGAGDRVSEPPTPAPAGRPSPRPRPRPRPEPELDQVVDAPAGPARGLPFADAPRWVVVALTAVVVVLLGAVAFLGYLAWHDARSRQAADDALAAARVGGETLFSYDHRTIDADIAAAKKVVTGKMATDYADTSGAIKPLAIENGAIVEASVSEAGLVSAEPDRVVVMLYLNQSTQGKTIQGTRVDYSRVRMTMVPVDGEWRIARAEPL
jgi:Mce-associated membrane protein